MVGGISSGIVTGLVRGCGFHSYFFGCLGFVWFWLFSAFWWFILLELVVLPSWVWLSFLVWFANCSRLPCCSFGVYFVSVYWSPHIYCFRSWFFFGFGFWLALLLFLDSLGCWLLGCSFFFYVFSSTPLVSLRFGTLTFVKVIFSSFWVVFLFILGSVVLNSCTWVEGSQVLLLMKFGCL